MEFVANNNHESRLEYIPIETHDKNTCKASCVARTVFASDSSESTKTSDKLKMIKGSMGELSIAIGNKERVFLGKNKASLYFNEFADLSLMTSDDKSEQGIGIASIDPGWDGLAISVWPKSGMIMPALVSKIDKRYRIELPENPPLGERCFVLDEDGAGVVTASYEYISGNGVNIVNPITFSSWLFSVGSKAAASASQRFSLEFQDLRFIVLDKKRSKRYAGSLLSRTDAEKRSIEMERLEYMLAYRGLGAIIPLYRLEKA